MEMCFRIKYPFQRLQDNASTDLKPTSPVAVPPPNPLKQEPQETGNRYLKELVQELDKYIKKVMEKTFQVYVWGPARTEDTKSSIIDNSDKDVLTEIVITNTKAGVHHSSILTGLPCQFLAGPTKDKQWNRLVELREKLMTTNLLLDQVLMHYTVMPTLMLPPVDEIRRSINGVKDILKGMKLEDLHLLFPPELAAKITPDHELCSILGMSSIVLEQLLTCEISERLHRGDEYILKQTVEDIYDGIMENDAVNDKYHTFLESVFTSSRLQIFGNIMQGSNLKQKQSVVYWVQRYLGNMFQYNILLSSEAKLLRDQRWSVDMDHRTCPELECSQQWDVPHIYAKSRENLMEFAKELPSQTHVTFFHGTDEISARHIVVNGIMSGKGSPKQDFSDGFSFYLTTGIETALDWARVGNFAPRAAVVAFRVPKDVIDRFTKLDLTSTNSMWRDVVNYNRTGRDRQSYKPSAEMRRMYRSADYVIGMDCDPSDSEPWPSALVHEGRHSQFCILSETMAEIMGDIRYTSVCFFDKSL